MTKVVLAHESRADISYNLHTALRKNMDSPASRIAWNLFYCLSDDTLSWFYSLVEKAVKNKVFDSAEDMAVAVRDAILEDSTFAGNHERAALHSTFQLLEPEEWNAYIHFLWGEVEESRAAAATGTWVDGSNLFPPNEGATYIVFLDIRRMATEHHTALNKRMATRAIWRGPTRGWQFKIAPLGLETPGEWVSHWQADMPELSASEVAALAIPLAIV